MTKHKYWIFISYAHQDAKIARRLKRKLEKHQIGARLRSIARTPPKPETKGHVFLDQDDIVKDGQHLPDVIKKEIAQSQKIIVICSPNSANSMSHVKLELAEFIDAGKWEDIHPIIVGGDPRDIGGLNDCFPAPLRQKYNDQGDPIGQNNPLSPDFRTKPSLNDPKEWANLLSGILGIDRKYLYNFTRKKRIQKTIAQIMLVAATLVLVNYLRPPLPDFIEFSGAICSSRDPSTNCQSLNDEFSSFVGRNAGTGVPVKLNVQYQVNDDWVDPCNNGRVDERIWAGRTITAFTFYHQTILKNIQGDCMTRYNELRVPQAPVPIQFFDQWRTRYNYIISGIFFITTDNSGTMQRTITLTKAETTTASAVDSFEESRSITLFRHRVVAGETVYGLARKYNISVTALVNENRLDETLSIHKGQILFIPPPEPTVYILDQ